MSLILRRYKEPKLEPDRDSLYLIWIRKQPCAICGVSRGVEAAHVGLRGLGKKCPDRQVIPLCYLHHRMGPKAHHVLQKKFWGFWKLDRYELIAKYNRNYEATEETARIEPSSETARTRRRAKTA